MQDFSYLCIRSDVLKHAHWFMQELTRRRHMHIVEPFTCHSGCLWGPVSAICPEAVYFLSCMSPPIVVPSTLLSPSFCHRLFHLLSLPSNSQSLINLAPEGHLLSKGNMALCTLGPFSVSSAVKERNFFAIGLFSNCIHMSILHSFFSFATSLSLYSDCLC